MRHNKRKGKLNRTGPHRKAMMANMLLSLVTHERIETTVPKAKELRRHADKLITIAKEGDTNLSAIRNAKAALRLHCNPLLTEEKARFVKARKEKADLSSYQPSRLVLDKLFKELGPRFKNREGGYTRIIRTGHRLGDGGDLCLIEYIDNSIGKLS